MMKQFVEFVRESATVFALSITIIGVVVSVLSIAK